VMCILELSFVTVVGEEANTWKYQHT
jgi:hypothetical protein